MFTLVIWQLVPEGTDLYIIPNSEIDEEMRTIMRGAQNKLINADDDINDALKLNAAVTHLKDEVEEEYKTYHGRFVQYKVEVPLPIENTHITYVYLSGWML